MKSMRQAPEHRFSAWDVLAGVSVALVLIPQATAYAELAGLPPHYGLYAAALPSMAAALFASSPYLQTGPVAMTALLTFGTLAPLADPRSPEFIALAALLALVVGVARLFVGLLKGGWLSYLMSRPMLTGFMSGASVLIVASQLPGALGSDAPDGGVVGRAVWALANPGSWQGPAMGLSALTVVVIVGGKRIHALVPGVLIAAVGGLVYSALSGYQGPVIGPVPEGLPPFSLDLPWGRTPTLVLPAVIIALVGFSEAASISRVFASEDRERWDPDREFLSQGLANLASGISGGFPIGGSFSRSSVARLSGARSRWTGLVSGFVVLLFLPFSGLLALLPRAILSGVVIAAVWTLFRPRELLGLWSFSKPQALVGWSTFGLTLALSPHVEDAVLIGILMAGAVHLLRQIRLDMTSRREGDTLHLEPHGTLWFGSAPALEDAMLSHLADEPGVSQVVIHCGGLGRIDLSGAWTLSEMLDEIRDAGIRIDLTGVPGHARRVLHAVGERD
jgi:SulP family sulfate permease